MAPWEWQRDRRLPQATVDPSTEQEEWEAQALRSKAWPARAPVRPATSRNSGRSTVRRFQAAVAAVPLRLPRGKTRETSSSPTAPTRRCRGDGGALRPSSEDPSQDGVAFHVETTWSRQFKTMSSTRQQQGAATGTATAGVTPSCGNAGRRSRSSNRWRPNSSPSPNRRNLGGVLDNHRGGFAAFNKTKDLAMHSQSSTKTRRMSSALPPRLQRGDDSRGVLPSPRKRSNVGGGGRGGRVVMAQMMVPTVAVCFGQESTGGQAFTPIMQ